MGVVVFPHEIGARVRAVADQYGAVHATRGIDVTAAAQSPREVATAWVGVYWMSEVLTRRSSIRLTTKVTTSSVSRTFVSTPHGRQAVSGRTRVRCRARVPG